jgi:hypothetical protein
VTRFTQWLRAQFLESHAQRNQDLEHWWQLPDDPTRVASRWRQPFVDWLAPAAFSEWHEKIAHHRVMAYDQLRPPLTRTMCLTVIVATLAVLGAPRWCWLLLVGAMIQIPLETYLQKYANASGPEPNWRLGRWMADVARRHFQTMTFNIGGVAGAVACPLTIIAVCFSPPGDTHSWIKVAALAAALIYLNSGLANVFLDPPNYTENSVMPPFMHTMRAYVPLISLAVVAGIVGVSAAHHRWKPDKVPIAFMCTALTLLLGSTLRVHDRVVAAAAFVGRQAVEAGRRELGGLVHDELGPAKSASRLDGVPLRDAVEFQALSAFLTHFGTRVRLFDSQRMDLDYLVKKIASPYGISPRDVVCDIGWDPAALRKEDHRTAVRMATVLVHNVGQNLFKSENRSVPTAFVVEGFTTGSGRDLRYHLAVRDHLPAIPEDRWCADGGTLSALRTWLRDTFNGDLTQVDIGDGTKRIVASWGDRPPITWQARGNHRRLPGAAY